MCNQQHCSGHTGVLHDIQAVYMLLNIDYIKALTCFVWYNFIHCSKAVMNSMCIQTIQSNRHCLRLHNAFLSPLHQQAID